MKKPVVNLLILVLICGYFDTHAQYEFVSEYEDPNGGIFVNYYKNGNYLYGINDDNPDFMGVYQINEGFNITKIGQIDFPESLISQANFEVVGDYLYMLDRKLYVFDISSPSQPFLANTLEKGINDIFYDVGNLLFIANKLIITMPESSLAGEIAMLTLSDPLNPQMVSWWSDGLLGFYSALEIKKLNETTAIYYNGSDKGFSKVDVSGETLPEPARAGDIDFIPFEDRQVRNFEVIDDNIAIGSLVTGFFDNPFAFTFDLNSGEVIDELAIPGLTNNHTNIAIDGVNKKIVIVAANESYVVKYDDNYNLQLDQTIDDFGREVIYDDGYIYGAYFDKIKIYNTGATPSTSLPDFTVTSAEISPSIVTPDSNFELLYTAANMGDTDYTGDITVSYVYSLDNLLDSNDGEVYNETINDLNAGESKNLAASFSLGSGATEGQYYIFAVLDPNGEIAESDENNNSNGASYQVVNSLPLTADFVANNTTIEVGGQVQFASTGQGTPISWTWTFDGGDPNLSSLENPIVVYSTPGTYDVSLVVNDGISQDTKTVTGYITVMAPALSADFDADRNNIQAGESISFTNESSGDPTSFIWTFEGGTPGSSTLENPTITFNQVGSFNVTLSIGDGISQDSETKQDYITVTVPENPIISDLSENDLDFVVDLNGVNSAFDYLGTVYMTLGENLYFATYNSENENYLYTLTESRIEKASTFELEGAAGSKITNNSRSIFFATGLGGSDLVQIDADGSQNIIDSCVFGIIRMFTYQDWLFYACSTSNFVYDGINIIPFDYDMQFAIELDNGLLFMDKNGKLYMLTSPNNVSELITLSDNNEIYPNLYHEFADRALFVINNAGDDELWITDGMSAGTSMISNFGGDAKIMDIISYNNSAYFLVDNGGVNEDMEGLWTSDGTIEGTTKIVYLEGRGQEYYYRSNKFNYGHKTLAVNQDLIWLLARNLDGSQRGLWKTDGSAEGTIFVTEKPGASGSIKVFNNHLFIDGLQQVWISDGTNENTIRIGLTDEARYFPMETLLDPYVHMPYWYFEFDQRLYFVHPTYELNSDSSFTSIGREVWRFGSEFDINSVRNREDGLSFCVNPTPEISISGAGTPTATLESNYENGNQWYLDGSPISGATDQTYEPTEVGTYQVEVIDGSCLGLSEEYELILTDINSELERWSYVMYPNPVEDLLSIQINDLKANLVNYSIIDTRGEIIIDRSGNKVNNDLIQIKVDQLTDGLYILLIETSNGMIKARFNKL